MNGTPGRLKRQKRPKNDEVRLTCSIEEAADILGIGRSTAYLAARKGDLPTIRLGGRVLVPRAALEQLLTTWDLSKPTIA